MSSTSTTTATIAPPLDITASSLREADLLNSDRLNRVGAFNYDALKEQIALSEKKLHELEQLEPEEAQLETKTSSELIGNALRSQIESINYETCEPGAENSFFVCDLGKVEKLLRIWNRNLPRIQPFYAVKCNPNNEILTLLKDLNVNFDCASKGEIEQVLKLGVSPDRIIYANPCKVGSFLRFASKHNINMTTFDNADELYKIKKFHPDCQLLLRIVTDDESAQCRLSTKYGAPLSNVENLLKLARKLELNIAGVSFHVGSGSNDNNSIIKAIRDSRFVFDKAEQMGFNMTILDVGGGFSFESFHNSSKALNYAIDKYFPVDQSEHIRIIAEPGRYFVANAFTLATNVIAKRGGVFDNAAHTSNSMIYINDGVYGNMNCILFDHQQPQAKVLFHKGKFVYNEAASSGQKYNVSIWGPTCDGLDCISKDTALAYNVTVGDWLYFDNLGAYTSAAASPFNGFESQAKTIYVKS